jgi:hypothetical protein
MAGTIPHSLIDHDKCLAVVIPAGIGEKSNVTGAFNGASQFALMFSAGAGLAARPDFSFIGDKAAQDITEFIVDVQIFISTKLADLRF